MTKRAVLYARVSGDDRHTEGRNLEGQLEACRQYALERGYAIVEELAEDVRGASGIDMGLAQLNRLLDMAQADQFDVLVVREVDRLARDMGKLYVIENRLKLCGVAVEYARGQYTDDVWGVSRKGLDALVAQIQWYDITQRLQRGRRQSVKAGNVNVGAHPPYGYQVAEQDGRRVLEVYEAEAAIVRLIYAWYVDGSADEGPMTIYRVRERLDQIGAPTYSLRGKGAGRRREAGRLRHWTRSTVYQILTNETYAGTWYYGKTRTEKRIVAGQEKEVTVTNPRESWLAVEVPAIVTREQWDAAQEQLERNRRRSPRKKYAYLLSGRVVCGLCDHKVAGSGLSSPGGRTYTYYRCPASKNPEDYRASCSLPAFDSSAVDAAVWAWLQGWLVDPEQLQDGLEEHRNGDPDRLQLVRDQLARLDREMARTREDRELILDLYVAREFSRAELLQRVRRLEDLLAAQEARQRELQAVVDADQANRDRVRTLQQFADRVRSTLSVAEADFATRERLVNELDLEVTLRTVGEECEIWITRLLGEVVSVLVHCS